MGRSPQVGETFRAPSAVPDRFGQLGDKRGPLPFTRTAAVLSQLPGRRLCPGLTRCHHIGYNQSDE